MDTEDVLLVKDDSGAAITWFRLINRKLAEFLRDELKGTIEKRRAVYSKDNKTTYLIDGKISFTFDPNCHRDYYNQKYLRNKELIKNYALSKVKDVLTDEEFKVLKG